MFISRVSYQKPWRIAVGGGLGILLIVLIATYVFSAKHTPSALPVSEAGFTRIAVASGTTTVSGQVVFSHTPLLICWSVGDHSASLTYAIGNPSQGPTTLTSSSQSPGGCAPDPGTDDGPQQVVFTYTGKGSFIAAVDEQGTTTASTAKVIVPHDGLILTKAGQAAATLYQTQTQLTAASGAVQKDQQSVDDAVSSVQSDVTNYNDAVSIGKGDLDVFNGDVQVVVGDSAISGYQTAICSDVSNLNSDLDNLKTNLSGDSTVNDATKLTDDLAALQTSVNTLTKDKKTLDDLVASSGLEDPDPAKALDTTIQHSQTAVAAAQNAIKTNPTTIMAEINQGQNTYNQTKAKYCP